MRGGRLAVAGIIAFAVILGSYLAYTTLHPYLWTLDPVDLGVYRSGGLIVRHVRPWPGASATGPPPGGTAGAGTSSGLHWRRARRWPAAGYWALAAALLALYGAWPGRLWGEPHDLGQFSLGLLWQPPNTDPEVYYRHGDRPWFAEYHWHGIQLLTGNAFLLGGLALLGILIAAALRTRATPSPTIPRDPTGPSSPASRAPSARTQS